MAVEQEPAPDDPVARQARPARSPVLLVDLDWRSVATVLALLVALALVVGAVRTASIGVTLIVVALFVAMALDPLVGRVQRTGVARGVAVLGVVVLVGAAFGLFVALAGPQLVSQTRTLGTELPRTVDSLRDVPVLGPHLVEWGVPRKVSEFLASLPERIGQEDANLGDVAKGVGFGLGAFVLGLLVTIGALLEGPRLVDTVRGAVPASGRPRADDIGRIVYSVIGRYFAGSLLIALLNGIWVSVWALIAGAPLSPVLGVWAALTSLIPQIGGLMGFVVVVLVSLAAGLVPAVIMTVTFLVFMLLTNHVLQPTIVGRAVQLSAPVTMLAAISGFTVGGVVGALFAVPTVGAIKAVVSYVRHPDEPPPSHPEHHSRFSLHRVVARLRHRARAADGGAAVVPDASARAAAPPARAAAPVGADGRLPPAWFSPPG
ncbi:AI-2E family transporter [Dermatobacter hominis]|uniref:AI-2E family transporter n=1 Tax=Dermatobacter hominis TaxID=2884263 RepID=UPI001D0FC3B2|nr:AI-2E family transporter [Dermatobacter hominis]UDY33990.1 AI-2E family transporter [Dermatobacter hominis]